jgi:zinc transporter
MEERKSGARVSGNGLAEHDNRGLVCAFKLGAVERVDHEVLAGQAPIHPHWLHFNLNDRRTRHYLESGGQISGSALELFLDPQPRIRIHLLEGCLVAVLADLQHELEGISEEFGLLRIYIDRERAISARNQPLQSLDTLRREMRAGLQVEAPFQLFERLVHCLSETFTSVVADLTNRVDSAEDDILAGRVHDQATALGRLRRHLAHLRRQLHADRAALGALRGKIPHWTGASAKRPRSNDASGVAAGEQGGLHEAFEHLDVAVHDIELLQERTRLLGEEVTGRLNEATSRHLYVLSVVTTVLLPVTLITGVFGMNVGGLPFLENPRGFLWACAIMLAALSVTVMMLRRR